MDNKLPKVFANKIEKKIKNNDEVYISKKAEPQELKEKNKKILTQQEDKTINKKINEIINSKNYIYRIPVILTLKDKEIKTSIIGKNSKSIITIDNELIKIEDIENIEIQEKNE